MKQSVRILPLLSSIVLLVPTAQATILHKAQSTLALNTSGTWTEAAAPDSGGADSIVFDNTITTIGGGNALFGANLAVASITVTNPFVNTTTAVNPDGVQIGNTTANTPGNTFQLILGSSGTTIDMSAATAPLLIGASVLIGANQTWNVADASSVLPGNGTTTYVGGNANSAFNLSQREDLVFTAASTAAPTAPVTTGIDTNLAFNLGGKTVTTTGAGTILVHSGYTISNGTINIGNGDSGAGVPFNGTLAYNLGGTLNGAFIIQSGGTRNAQVNSDVTLNVGTILKFQTNSGSMLVNGTLNLGYNGTSNVNGAILLLVAANSAVANALTVAGPVNILGNSIIATANSSINGNNSQPITVSGPLSGSGALTLANTLTNATAFFVLSGNNLGYSGTVTVNGPSGNRYVRLINANSGSAAATWVVAANNAIQVSVAGGTVQLGTLNSNAGEGTVTNPTTATTSTINVGAGDFGGAIVNTGTGLIALSKATSGTLTLRGANTYTGATTVNSGTLLIRGTTSGTASVAVASGATLGGEGTLTSPGAVTLANGSALSPGATGAATNTLTVSAGSLDLSGAAGGTNTPFKFELGDSTIVAANDRLLLSAGALNIGVGLLEFTDFTFTALSGFGPGTYTLFDTNAALAGGSTLGVNLMGTVGGFEATLFLSGGGQDVALLVVPEPQVVVSLFGGLGLLVGLRRRRGQ